MKLHYLLTAVTALLLSSCSVYKVTYDVALDNVKVKGVDNEKITQEEKNEKKQYRFQDDYINVLWSVVDRGFEFELKNNSDKTITVDWDNITYVDTKGVAGHMIKGNTKLIEKDKTQIKSSIPSGAKLVDTLYPSSNFDYQTPMYSYGVKVSGGWQRYVLIPSFYEDKKKMEEGAPYYVGKTMTILMPITIGDAVSEYTFVFRVTDYTTGSVPMEITY